MEVENQVDSNGGGGADLSDAQMDSLINNETPSRDIPMKSQAEPTAKAAQEYAIKHKGQEIKAPLEKILQWAQLGYDHPQKAQEWNQTKAKLDEYVKKEAQFKEYEQKWAPYKEVDEFATKNPDWWAQVQKNYQEKISQAQSNPEIAALKNELNELKEFKNSLTQKEQSQKVQEEDKQLSSEVEQIRKTYSNFDFDAPDQDGFTLEMKVLKHAEENGIKSFKTAFRDYCHDQLMSKAEEKGKETISKEVQKRTKLGILGETSKPTKGLKVAEQVGKKSYDDLLNEAKEELGLA
jgi:FtsZ-binding cell division protein ZapB